MVLFTRRHYEMIGKMLRDLPVEYLFYWFNQWDKVFRKDNPRYEPDKFHAYVYDIEEGKMKPESMSRGFD